MSYWGLNVTFCDHKNNQFLLLGGAAWKTKRERDERLATIPKSNSDSAFIVDVENENGVVYNRFIDKRTVEMLLSRSAKDLIREARKQEEAVWDRGNPIYRN